MAPPEAASHWGAIAMNAAGDKPGVATGLPNRRAAEQAAIAQCRTRGGAGCTVAIAYGNGCGAVIDGADGIFSGADVNRDFAARERWQHAITPVAPRVT